MILKLRTSRLVENRSTYLLGLRKTMKCIWGGKDALLVSHNIEMVISNLQDPATDDFRWPRLDFTRIYPHHKEYIEYINESGMNTSSELDNLRNGS